MVDGIRNKPTPEVERIYERNASVGQFLKRLHDAQPAQKEATRLDPIIEKIWSKKARRYRYAAGVKTLTGKKLGGQFAAAPEDAPATRKRRKPRR